METIFPAVGLWVGAEQQWQDLVAEMRRQLPERLCNDLIYRAQSLAQQTTQAFLGPIAQRLDQLERSRRPRGQGGARQAALQSLRNRLTLMNPAEIARELAAGLTPPNLEEYNRIVADLARAMPHPDIARRYALPPQALQSLADQVAAAGRPLAQALSEHAQNLKTHADLVATLRTQPLMQKGARLLGKAVVSALEPLVGRNTVEQLFGLDNPLARSMEQVELGWDSFRREFLEFHGERQRRHQLIYLSLVGGLFLGVQRDLQHLGCELAVDGQGNCEVVPARDRQERIRLHLEEAQGPVLAALRADDLPGAERQASALVSHVVTDPVVARTSYEGRSVGYRAYALHLSALLAQARERWDAGQPEVAAAIWRQVFESYPCLVADADLISTSGEELPLVTAAFRLTAYAEWLRDSNRPAEADRLLVAQVGYVDRWRSRPRECRGLPGEALSPELVDWAGALATYLRREPRERRAAPVPEQACPMGRYPAMVRRFHQAVGGQLERSPLDQYLRGRANLTRGVAVAAATGGVGLLGTLAWLLLL